MGASIAGSPIKGLRGRGCLYAGATGRECPVSRGQYLELVDDLVLLVVGVQLVLAGLQVVAVLGLVDPILACTGPHGVIEGHMAVIEGHAGVIHIQGHTGVIKDIRGHTGWAR